MVTKAVKSGLRVVVVVGVANFFAFIAAVSFLGGSAANGYASNGHFFLKDHGRITEVSHAVFDYSRWHCYSLWVTHPMLLLAGAALMTFFRKG